MTQHGLIEANPPATLLAAKATVKTHPNVHIELRHERDTRRRLLGGSQ